MEIKTGSKFQGTPEGFVRIDITTTTNSKYAPNKDDLEAYKQGSITWDEFAQRYRDHLKANFAKDPRYFDDILENDRVFLVCYEKDDKHCHRRLLKEFLEERQMF